MILGGPEAAADYAAILVRPGAPDYIVLGEGEETLRQLLVQLEEGQADFPGSPGSPGAKGDKIQRTPDRAPLDLAALPFSLFRSERLSPPDPILRSFAGVPLSVHLLHVGLDGGEEPPGFTTGPGQSRSTKIHYGGCPDGKS